ncbi:MAG TPA: hypothetical protein VK783_12775 [Bacteroidia bacterium]|jgi:hypothetical protein|nr:hypothetical protein [Bacteroidia bacterium]
MKNKTDILKESISLLEQKQIKELIVLKEQFHRVYESLKPINQIKGALHGIATMPDIKNAIISNVIGLTTGYLSKKVVVGGSHNPLKKLLGIFLQFAVANTVLKHSGIIKTGTEVLV